MRHKTFRLCVVLLSLFVFVYFILFQKLKSSYSCQLVHESVEIFQNENIFGNFGRSNSFTKNFQVIIFNRIHKNDGIKMHKQELSQREILKITTLKDVFDFLYKNDVFLLDINYINSFSIKSTPSSLNVKIGLGLKNILTESEKQDSGNKSKLVTFGLNSKFFFQLQSSNNSVLIYFS